VEPNKEIFATILFSSKEKCWRTHCTPSFLWDV